MMTEQATERREAGPREIDMQIAVLMGGLWDRGSLFSHVKLPTGWLLVTDRGTIYEDALPYYSTDIAAAFQVVEKMRANGWVFGTDCEGVADKPATPWYAYFAAPDPFAENHAVHSALEAALPLAICRAALKAVANESQPAKASVQNPS